MLLEKRLFCLLEIFFNMKTQNTTQFIIPATHIFRVLKTIHNGVGISKQAMDIVQGMIQDLALRIMLQVFKLYEKDNKASSRCTVSSRDIQTAVRLLFPSELAKHAIAQGFVRFIFLHITGTKAVCKVSIPVVATTTSNKRVSKSTKAGLLFPVSRVHTYLKTQSMVAAHRISQYTAIYLTAVLEYITAEIMELSGYASKDLQKKRIIPRHVMLAIRGDEELDKLFAKSIIPNGGVIPHIHRALLHHVAVPVAATKSINVVQQEALHYDDEKDVDYADDPAPFIE